MRLLSIVPLAKKKTEKHSQPPQISPTRCRIEEERWAIILTGLFDRGRIEYVAWGTYRRRGFNIFEVILLLSILFILSFFYAQWWLRILSSAKI
jgi:hypothetical protein